MQDVFLLPIMKMVDKLGINKTASEKDPRKADGLSNAQLADELGKLAGDMPEDLAGQDMHDEKIPLDNPEPAPAAPTIENNQDSAYRLQKRTDDNLDNLSQTSAPLSNPSDLDTDQDPLARMAAKIACVVEPLLTQADAQLNGPAAQLNKSMQKHASPLQSLLKTISANPGAATATALGAGGLIGGGLGFLGGKAYEKKKDEPEDAEIFSLGAQIGGQMVANQILEQLGGAAAQGENKEGV